MIDQLNVKSFLPTFNFLGSLVETVPSVAFILVTQYGEARARLTSDRKGNFDYNKTHDKDEFDSPDIQLRVLNYLVLN